MKDILNLTKDSDRRGIIVTYLAQKANLSHYVTMEKIQKLQDTGLIESTFNGRNRSFVITEKGMYYLQQIHTFSEFAEELNIRC